jgi:putative glutamine amidotransferase
VTTRPVIAIGWPKADYLAALERAGADPRILDPTRDALPDVLDLCAGVLLTGGADVDPSHYGDSARHPTLSLDPARDAFELELARAAMARGLPLLAICRGVQLLNVAAGGTLFQDLPSQHPTAINHRVKEPTNQKVHPVTVAPHSRLSELLGSADREISVNSRHHQAVKQVAPGFAVVATAPDGVVEGIERPGPTFCVGVQWHPENFWRTGEFASLFEGLVAAARPGITRLLPRG